MNNERAEYLKSIDVFLQREDDFLLYTPDVGAEPEPSWGHGLWRYYRQYILEGHEPRLVEGFVPSGHWIEDTDRCVAKTLITPEVKVLTVFLCRDHNHSREGPPLLFEIMIFGLPGEDEYQERYATWDEAEAGHARAVAVAQGKIEERSA